MGGFPHTGGGSSEDGVFTVKRLGHLEKALRKCAFVVFDVAGSGVCASVCIEETVTVESRDRGQT